MLVPSREGTAVRLAAGYDDIATLIDGGLSLSDVLLPRTSPAGVEQLSLFSA